jgi:DNA-binding LacI/PurR family transcriptional regulator
LLQEGGVIQRQRAIGTKVINPLGGNWVSIVCEMDVFSPNSGSLFHRSVIYYLRHFLREAGLPSRVSIGETEPGQSSSNQLTSLDFVADIEANRLAGVLAVSTNPAAWWLKKLKKQNVPVVGSNMNFPYRVVFDPWEDLSKALRCLMDLGRRRIAYVGWVERTHDHVLDERLPKALDELEKCYPVTIHKEWIKGDIYPERPGAGWEEMREIWGSYEEKPDGLIIDNEHLLPDVEHALAELGVQVPKDLVIVSHRTRGNHYQPRFPVIFQENDPHIFAHRMVEYFLRLYRGEQVASPTVTVPRLLIDANLAPSAGTLPPLAPVV